MTNKFILIVASVLIVALGQAQDSKYLVGAVPEVDNKIIFSENIKTKSATDKSKLFELMKEWSEKNFQPEEDLNSRLLIADSTKYSIACLVEKYLVFQKNSFVLDRAKMSFQLILTIENNNCNAVIRNIRYEYSDQKGMTLAENLISDKYALNKEQNKLNRYYDKFRIHTIDTVDALFKDIEVYLNGINTAGAANNPAVLTQQNVTPQEITSQNVATQEVTSESVASQAKKIPEITTSAASSLEGYKEIKPERIPGNIIKLLKDEVLVATNSAHMVTSSGALGVMNNVPCMINSGTKSFQIEKGQNYTISFFTEAYSEALHTAKNSNQTDLTPILTPDKSRTFSEAWMIIECKCTDTFSSEENTPLQIGEIKHIWVK